MRSVLSACLLSLVLVGCQTATPPAAGPNPMLTGAGFIARKPTTPDQANTLSALPPNRMVKQTVNGKTNFLYSDPACGCVHVGDAQAFRNFTDMNKTMFEMNRNSLDPGLNSSGIEDLGSWSPL